jgi:hypothetical protein
MLCKMLKLDDSVEGSHLWKMTSIQMVALACTFDVPIRGGKDAWQGEPHFELNSTNDQLFVSLLKMQELRKK